MEHWPSLDFAFSSSASWPVSASVSSSLCQDSLSGLETVDVGMMLA